MIKHRTLATVSAAVMFAYYLICSTITAFFPEFALRIYAMSFHGLRLTNLEASILTLPEMLIGATFNALMVWVLVCSVGWIYNEVVKK